MNGKLCNLLLLDSVCLQTESSIVVLSEFDKHKNGRQVDGYDKSLIIIWSVSSALTLTLTPYRHSN
jgi:hypothetical protein